MPELSASQEMMEAAINSIQSELEETIKNQMDNVLSSVNQWTQGIRKELNTKIEEMQLSLQTVMTSLNM
jgi:BMFP domain-containing protein YqiC